MFKRLATAYHYRELARNFTVRNLKIKYKGSLLGFLWSFITPLLMMLVYTLVFRWIIRIEVEWPFAVFLLTGLLPWIFFANSLNLSANSIIENANLIKKVYFPRELIPFTSVLSMLINFLLAMIILVFFMIYYQIPPHPPLVTLPLVMFIHLVFTLGLSLICAAVAVFFRDLLHILEIILLVWFYAVPIIYPMSYVEQHLPAAGRLALPLYKLNPMVEITELYRCALLYNRWPTPVALLVAGAWAVASFVIGYWIFTRTEPAFVKEI
ncbi:ABC transporter permease [bacterium]|nr:ABC transporter permease [candidate division CSSED10-310 bacterium]